MRQVKRNGAAIAQYAFDGDGNRVQSVVNSVTTKFVGGYFEWSGATSTMVKYYSAAGKRLAMRTGSGSGTTGLLWLAGDHLGSTSVAANPDGSLVTNSRQLYKPWGETRAGAAPTPYQYTGQRNETAIGLYFYNARWYDYTIGRFVQADTITPGGVQGLDRFAYANNNAMKYTDPSGHCINGATGTVIMEQYPYGTSGLCPGYVPPDSVDGLDGDSVTQEVYNQYLMLYRSDGWWWDIYGANGFDIWDFLNLVLSIEFMWPGTDFSSAILQETVVRNFYYLYGGNADSSSKYAALKYIGAKKLTVLHNVSPTALLDREKRNPLMLMLLNNTDFAAAFRNPGAWKSGKGDGNVPYEWGNLSMAECTVATCPSIFTPAEEENPRLAAEKMELIANKFQIAEMNSPWAPGDQPSIKADEFYLMAGSGNSAFIVTGNQVACLYNNMGCP